jgi:serine/threonine-protein kinase
VVDHATAKDLEVRYASAADLIADLEDALAIETARTGHITGEATTVFQSLPAQKQSRVSGSVLHPWRWLAGIAIVAVAIVAAFALLTNQAERGTGTQGAKPPATLQAISLGQSRAKDYDPLGDRQEHPETAAFALDRDAATVWGTETYLNGNLAKAGVGLAIDAKPSVSARQLELRTPTPGWSGKVLAAATGATPPATIDDPAWTQVGTIPAARSVTRVDLDTAGKSFRWYLVWIETFAAGQGQGEISEAYLYR